MKKIILLLAVPTLAWASLKKTPERDCYPIDLRNETLGQVRNQHEVAWCYAFTGADMLGYTFNEKEKMSAADIAIGYNTTGLGKFARWINVNFANRKDEETRMMAHQTGFNKVSLDFAMKEGWCPEAVFPSEVWTKRVRISSGKSPKWSTQTVLLKEAMLDIFSLHEKRNSLDSDNLPFYYEFKNVGPEEFLALLKRPKLPQFYSGLRQSVCQGERRPFNNHWKVSMVFKHPRIFSKVNEQLNLGRLVGLDYDGTILENHTYRKIDLGELHTSPLVARRWNHQRKSCEFLIRNSYGTACTDYDRQYECEQGHIWLDESYLYPTMTSIVYMLSPRN